MREQMSVKGRDRGSERALSWWTLSESEASPHENEGAVAVSSKREGMRVRGS